MLTSQIFPALASLDEVEQRAERAYAAGREGIPTIDFGPNHRIVFVVEDGESLVWADSKLLEELATADPFELARDNLRARTAEPLLRTPIAKDRAAWFMGEDDGLASGRLLLHDLWAPLQAELPGELLVRVPVRGAVLCCSNVAADMGLVDAVATEFIENAPASGAPVVAAPWLAFTEQGWAGIEL